MDYFFSQLTHGTPYQTFDFGGAMWRLGDENDLTVSPAENMNTHYDHFFRHRGEIYAPLRDAIQFPGDDDYRKLFFLRDPRDVSVSMFYSMTQSHPLPKNPTTRALMIKNRKEWPEMGIDNVVVDVLAPTFAARYDSYFQIQQASSDSLFLSYDDYIKDVEAFTRRITDWLNITPSDATLETIVTKANPIAGAVDASKHRRSGRSRQFETELRPTTIAKVNEILGPALQNWGFEV